MLENTEAEEEDKDELVDHKASAKASDGLLDFLDSGEEEHKKAMSAEALDVEQGKTADTEKISSDSDPTHKRS